MNNILRQKHSLNIDANARDIIDILSISDNIKIMGSQQYQSQLYAGDYDLYEIVNGSYTTNEKAAVSYVKKLQNVIRKLLKKDGVFIGDIKSGERNGEPVRWKPRDILKGEVDGVELKDTIQSPTLTKVDVIAWISGKYTDFSIIYEFKNKSKVLNPVEQTREGIVADMEDLKKEGQFFKVLKRQFSLAVIDKKASKLEKLNEILNSDLGGLYAIVSDLKTILFLIENKDHISKEKLEDEFNSINVRLGYLSSLPQINTPSLLKKIEGLEDASIDTIERKLKDIVDDLSAVLNRKAKKLMS